MAGHPEHFQVGRAPVGWVLWLLWILATTLGWPLGWAMGVWTTSVFIAWGPGESTGLPLVVCQTAWGAIWGAVLGAIQWPILRWRIAGAGGWVLASAVGWTGGWWAWFGVGQHLAGALGWAMLAVGATGGAAVGALQSLVLRRRARGAGWWVLASSVGWAASWGVLRIGIWSVVGWLGSGAVAGAITGSVLVWLLRQPLAPGREAARE